MADFEFRGSQDLARLAARLKEEGRGDLRRELLKSIRTGAQKAVPDIQASARDKLPHTGGLADRVASQVYAVRSSLAGSGAKVSLQGRGMKELRDIDSGAVRHPVWGHRTSWVAQSVPSGFFTEAVAHRAPEIRGDIAKVMGEVARRITSGI